MTEHRYSRRTILKWLAAGAAIEPLLAACRRPPPRAGAGGARRLAKVLASPERVVRQVTGLRPFRRSGFNVSVERLGDKAIVHNYGHGGGGVSLSWGTADLALQHALAVPARDAAVVGCGAVGLATARLLQDHGFAVTIYTRDLPPHTTSNAAGASWAPVMVADPDRRTSAFDAQFVRAARYAYRHFQTLLGARYGVSWRESYLLAGSEATAAASDDAAAPPPSSIDLLLVADLRPPVETLAPGEHQFGARSVARTRTLHVDPPVYLTALLEDFRAAGGRVVARELGDAQGVRELPHPIVVNCAGLGAGALFADDEMLPIKGQLTVLAPQREVDYMTVGPGELYMMPRRDGIVLGGTHQRGVWSLAPDPAEAARILRGHQRLFASMP